MNVKQLEERIKKTQEKLAQKLQEAEQLEAQVTALRDELAQMKRAEITLTRLYAIGGRL